MNLKMSSLSSCERDHPMLSAILSNRAISGELTRAEIVLSDVLMIPLYEAPSLNGFL